MRTLNKVILLGYVAAEPIEKKFDNRTKCVFITLKTKDFYGPADNRKSDKNFHSLVLWNGISEKAATIIQQGDILQVIGRLKNKKIDGEQGVRTEVVVEEWTKIPSLPAFTEDDDEL